MTGVILLFLALGLAVGSFGNVLILRLRTGETFGGRSHCAVCKATLAWHDLIPVLSYIFLRGKCRTCATKISIRYLMIECATAALFVLAAAFYPTDLLLALATATLLATLLFASVFDAERQQLPDLFTGVITLAALVIVFRQGTALSGLLGASLCFIWFGLQWAVSRGRAVGTGDLFLAMALGLWLGFAGAASMLVLSYITGAIIALILLATRTITLKQQRISFAPFLAAGALFTFLGVGDLYLSLFH